MVIILISKEAESKCCLLLTYLFSLFIFSGCNPFQSAIKDQVPSSTTSNLNPIVCSKATFEYYVDPDGSDSNDGQSPNTPWKTLNKVVATSFKPCTNIYFKRGGTWRGQLLPASGDANMGVVKYSSYGSGNLPTILGSVDTSSRNSWTNISGYPATLWRSTIASLDGSQGNLPLDIGNLIFNSNSGSLSVGYKKFSTDYSSVALGLILTKQGDFIFDKNTGYVWIYSVQNPGTYYSSIEAALSRDIVYSNGAKHDFTIEKMAFKFGGKGGINIIDGSNIIIQDAEISYIGGAEWIGHPNQRLGDGFQLWRNAKNVVFQRNKVWETYDGGVTNQNNGSNEGIVTNIVYQNNVIWNTPFACFIIMNYGPGASSMSHVKFINNTCANSQLGWSMNQRPDIKSMQLYIDAVSNPPSQIEISNNIFYGGLVGTYIKSISVGTWTTSALAMQKNNYFGMSGTMDIDVSSTQRWQQSSSDPSIWFLAIASGAVTLKLDGTPCSVVPSLSKMISVGQCYFDVGIGSNTLGNFFLRSIAPPGNAQGFRSIIATVTKHGALLADHGAFLLSQFPNYQTLTGFDLSSTVADPLFVNGTGFDFHLSANSPCKTGGIYFNLLEDFDFFPRPTSGTGGTGIGAFEFH